MKLEGVVRPHMATLYTFLPAFREVKAKASFYTDVVEPEVLCSQYASLILDEQRGLAEAKVYLQRGVGYAMRLTA